MRNLPHPTPHTPYPTRRSPRLTRRGFTLVELLIAMAITVVIVSAMAQVFAIIGDNIKDARAVLEMNGQLRSAALRMELDFDGLTTPARPWPRASSALGYLEYVEGPGRDFNPFAGSANPLNPTAPLDPFIVPGTGGVTKSPVVMANTTIGDLDDVLAFTARAASDADPFRGQIPFGIRQPSTAPEIADGRLVVDPSIVTPTLIESSLAEIIWWTTLEDLNGNDSWDEGERVTLHRRAFLIRPDLNLYLVNVDANGDNIPNMSMFFQDFDLSAHPLPTGNRAVTNSLADLTKRENRIARLGALNVNTGFPFPLGFNPTHQFGSVPGLRLGAVPGLVSGTNNPRQGDDVVLSHVVAFDVKAFDPFAPVYHEPNLIAALTPNDRGWYDLLAADPRDPTTGFPISHVGLGAFVDLNYDVTNDPRVSRLQGFSGAPEPRSGLVSNPAPSYCTWSFHYEHDNVNQDGDGFTDEGTDGLDNDNINGADDVGERETAPPYPVPLRGLKVHIRVIENDSKQVRQTEISTKLVPE